MRRGALEPPPFSSASAASIRWTLIRSGEAAVAGAKSVDEIDGRTIL